MVKAQRLTFLCEESVSGVRLYLLPGQLGSVRDQTSEGVCVWEGVWWGYVWGRESVWVSTAHLTDLLKPSRDVSIWAHL